MRNTMAKKPPLSAITAFHSFTRAELAEKWIAASEPNERPTNVASRSRK